MPRPVTLFIRQWADLPVGTHAERARWWGHEGLGLACWGDHFNVQRGVKEGGYGEERKALLARYGLKVWAISHHLVGQAVWDRNDERHRAILPEHVWDDCGPGGVGQRPVQEMMDTARPPHWASLWSMALREAASGAWSMPCCLCRGR